MIYVYIGFLLLVGGGGLFWYILKDAVIQFLDEFVATYPGCYPMPVVEFIKSVWAWMPWLMLFGGLIWVYVMTQRSYPEGYI